jgi:hypothetical protein
MKNVMLALCSKYGGNEKYISDYGDKKGVKLEHFEDTDFSEL